MEWIPLQESGKTATSRVGVLLSPGSMPVGLALPVPTFRNHITVMGITTGVVRDEREQATIGR